MCVNVRKGGREQPKVREKRWQTESKKEIAKEGARARAKQRD